MSTTRDEIKTKAALKRYLQVGAELRRTYHHNPALMQNTYLKVEKVQRNAVMFGAEPGMKHGLWLYWNKASYGLGDYEFEFHPGGFEIYKEKETCMVHVASYRYLIHESDCTAEAGECECSKPTAASGPQGHDPDGLRSE